MNELSDFIHRLQDLEREADTLLNLAQMQTTSRDPLPSLVGFFATPVGNVVQIPGEALLPVMQKSVQRLHEAMQGIITDIKQIFVTSVVDGVQAYSDLRRLGDFNEMAVQGMYVSEVKNLPAHKNKTRKDNLVPYTKIVFVLSAQWRITYSTELLCNPSCTLAWETK